MHHIIPKCIGGTNDRNNIVALTPEEHYVAHQLLVKIHPTNDKLIFAAHRMGTSNNKLYGWLRRAHNANIGKYTSKPGKSNSQYGTMWITNGSLNKKVKKNTNLPEGWYAGRTSGRYINNGTIAKVLKPGEALPKGWEYGKVKSTQSGSKNSQFGTIWITDGVHNKKLKADIEIPTGWYRGRSGIL